MAKETKQTALLALADGKVFEGIACGASGECRGEVVFNTSMTGYQEILTDPSYAKQLLTFTYPHIGNVGCNEEDVESSKVQASGLIVREISEHYSSYRAKESLESYLKRSNISGISNIDTRELVLHLRDHGSKMGIISHVSSDNLNSKKSELVDKAKSLQGMEGQDLVKEVSCTEPYTWSEGTWSRASGYKQHDGPDFLSRPHIVALDFGVKYNILRLLVEQGFRVTVVPAKTDFSKIKALSPDGVFLSNGPGDPAPLDYAINTVKELVGKYPIFGICLGHQILGHALGAPTFKLPFGHRGGNHPVRDELTGKVEITVQNHGFATDLAKVPSGLKISHVNLNDQTVEGFSIPDANAFSIQYHPESSPGPRDADYLFKRFRNTVLGE